jgi:hypothetical protein
MIERLSILDASLSDGRGLIRKSLLPQDSRKNGARRHGLIKLEANNM